MHPILAQLGPITLRSYTILLDAALLVGAISLALQGRRLERRPVEWLDAGLVAVVFGLIGGRAEHVLIHREYFAQAPTEIPQLWLGGIEWHLAALVGLGGLALGCRWRRVGWASALDALALAVPLGAALVFGGCWLGGYGYGREVQTLAAYPPGLAAESPDLYGLVAPRLNTQLFGVAASLIVLIGVALLARRVRQPGVAFWAALAAVALIDAALAFTRGDPVPMFGSLRLDAILALVVAVAAGAALAVGLRRAPSQP